MQPNVYVVIASINELANMARFKDHFNASCKVIIVDEGNALIRKRNECFLDGLSYEFYGPRERVEWFKERFGRAYRKYVSVIPERCHAETSFGFLVAYEEGADVIIEIDDDVFPYQGYRLVEGHVNNLSESMGLITSSSCRWYNTMNNILPETNLYPRGHPYAREARPLQDKLTYEANSTQCILNMGLWANDPDLDALTLLYMGSLNGKSYIKSVGIKHNKVIVDKGTYFAVCSMNAAFKAKVVPAFYQLYMNYMGIDRFDDIWSGLFLKKIANHLGDRVCLGAPVVLHDKRPRDIFKDLRAELEGMAINEALWQIVDSIELAGKDYHECYSELSDGLEKSLDKFKLKLHRDFMKLQVKKMKLWLDIIDGIR